MPDHRTAPASANQSTTRVPGPEPEAEPGTKSWLDLSLTQVLGGALAAMTAAAIGSRVGAGGTLLGAALASVIAAVAGALYTASLRRTRETVRTAIRGK